MRTVPRGCVSSAATWRPAFTTGSPPARPARPSSKEQFKVGLGQRNKVKFVSFVDRSRLAFDKDNHFVLMLLSVGYN